MFVLTVLDVLLFSYLTIFLVVILCLYLKLKGVTTDFYSCFNYIKARELEACF